MKKVNYEFVTGEVVEVEVSEYWEEVLKEMDRLDYNNDKKETRRHVGLDTGFDGSDWLIDGEADPEEIILNRMTLESGIEEAFKLLTANQKDAFISIRYMEMSVSDYAFKRGISQPAATYRLNGAEKILKKFL